MSSSVDGIIHYGTNGQKLEVNEPHLNYSRMGGDIPGLLASDTVSCAACNSKFLVLGTHWGQAYVMDFNGTFLKKLSVHMSSVTEVCIDSSEEYIASSGEDGRVVLSSLFNEDVTCYEFKRPIKCLQLDPAFNRTKRFVAGGNAGEVVLFEKSWRGPKKVVLASVDGVVVSLAWKGNLLAYATEVGIGIYDVRSSRDVCRTNVPFYDERPDLYRCHLVWKDDKTLLIGWHRVFQIIEVHGLSMFDTSPQAQITTQITTEFTIGGMLPFDKTLLLLALHFSNSEENATDATQVENRSPPECILFNSAAREHTVSTDVLSINGYSLLNSCEYRVIGIPEEQIYFLISPKDIISIKPRDANDRIEWRLARQQYEEALKVSIEALDKGMNIKSEYRPSHVGQRLLAELLDEEDFDRAASLCPMVLGQDPELWERWIYVFLESEGLDFILPYLPLSNPILNRTIYEVILAHYLADDFETFNRLIQKWPMQLFNAISVITALEETLVDFPTSRDLLLAAIVLYRSENMVSKEILCHMRLNDPQTCLKLIDCNPHVLGPVMRQHGKEWLNFHFQASGSSIESFLSSRTVRQLVSLPHVVSPVEIVQRLEGDQEFLFVYLFAMFQEDPHFSPELHALLLELIVTFRPQGLMQFLMKSIYYPLDKALELCETRDLLPEQVYVLGRIGNNKKALEIMIDRMDDIDMAIDYAIRQHDEELWNDLVEFAIRKPKYWRPLFVKTGMYLEPIKLIKRVPQGTQIDGLKELLTLIVQDVAAQIDLRSQCHQVLRHDVLTFMGETMRHAKQAVHIPDDVTCLHCEEPLLLVEPQNPVHVEFCGQMMAFHSCFGKADRPQ